MSDGTVAAIVLAAGDSTRMGRPKLLLPFGATTLLGHCVHQAEASTVDVVVVVTGKLDEALRRSISLERARWARNPHPQSGTIETSRIGIAAAGDCDYYMLLTGDAPNVDSGLINSVVSFAKTEQPVDPVRTEYAGGAWGHPYLIPQRAVAGLADLTGDKTLVGLLRPGLDATDRPEPRDINTWEDYLAACAEFGYESAGSAPTA